MVDYYDARGLQLLLVFVDPAEAATTTAFAAVAVALLAANEDMEDEFACGPPAAKAAAESKKCWSVLPPVDGL